MTVPGQFRCSQAGKLSEMFEKRRALYERFADISVSNDGPVEETLAQIMAALEKKETVPSLVMVCSLALGESLPQSW